jgi:hypothetical protein
VANGLEIVIPNSLLQFSKAMLKVKTSLFGIRYFMREWFFSVAIVIISAITTILFLGAMVFFMLAREYFKAFLINSFSKTTSSRSKYEQKKDKQ